MLWAAAGQEKLKATVLGKAFYMTSFLFGLLKCQWLDHWVRVQRRLRQEEN